MKSGNCVPMFQNDPFKLGFLNVSQLALIKHPLGVFAYSG